MSLKKCQSCSIALILKEDEVCNDTDAPMLRELDGDLLETGFRNERNRSDSMDVTCDSCCSPAINRGSEGTIIEEPVSQLEVEEEKKAVEIPLPKKRLRSSKSIERHLSEAAQFFEAIGETPQTLPTKIIEEESSDDDDDTDEESEIQNKRAKEQNQLFHSLLSGISRSQEEPFCYRGLATPEIVSCGTSRGNYAQLHRKAWLEVSDKYHRYGKNLRRYYKHWEGLSHPTNKFFDWLDSKGDSAGQPLPNLDICPRSCLDSDTVLYITNPQVTAQYALTIFNPKDSSPTLLDVNQNPVNTSPDGWIFVLRDSTIYAAPKITSISTNSKAKQRFHHSSFFGGKAVKSAGIIVTNPQGKLIRLYPHSGHYRPGEAHIQRMLFFLQRSGFDLSSFDVDIQQLRHVAREKDQKKTHSLYLMPASYVASYLTHKALMIGEGVFGDVHKVRRLRNDWVDNNIKTNYQ